MAVAINTDSQFQTWVFSSAWREASQVRCDRCLPVFRQTLDTIQQLMVLRPDPRRPDLNQHNGKDSLWCLTGRGSGIIMALYHVATKCRDSSLRRKALAAFDRLSLQEGLLSTNLLAPIAQEIVLLEEQRARRITGIPDDRVLTCKDVTEQARLIDVQIDADYTDQGVTRLVYSEWKGEWPGFEIGTHCFTIAR